MKNQAGFHLLLDYARTVIERFYAHTVSLCSVIPLVYSR